MTSTNVYWPEPYPDSLGGLVGADDVRDNVESTIVTWSAFYLTALSGRLAFDNRIGGANQPPNPLPDFSDWPNQSQFRNYGVGQAASFYVTVPGTSGVPELQGNRNYIATWRAQVEVSVLGTTWKEAADLVSWYEKVVRWCIIQHRSLGGFAMATAWAGATYTPGEHTSTRTEANAILGLDVTVNDVIDATGGPATVPSGIPTGDPTVLTTDVTIIKVPDTQPI